MRSIALLAEYDPLHLGHCQQIRDIRAALGEGSALIVALSSYFTQRGLPALLSPRKRAELALRAGADLVILVPQIFSSAEGWQFARGGASLLLDTGLVSVFACGSECQDLAALKALAGEIRQHENEWKPEFQNGLRSALSPQQSRSRFLQSLYPELPVEEILNRANSRLALAYLTECLSRPEAQTPRFFLTKRIHENELSAEEKEKARPADLCSATVLRERLLSSWEKKTETTFVSALEETSQDLPVQTIKALLEASFREEIPSYEYFYRLSFNLTLREGSPEKLSDFRYWESGLAGRLYPLARRLDGNGDAADALVSAVSRNFTKARVQRAFVSLLLGIDAECSEACGARPAYLFPLAFNPRGKYLLKRMRKAASLPIAGRFSAISSLGAAASAQAEVDRRAEALWRYLSGSRTNELLLPPLYLKKP